MDYALSAGVRLYFEDTGSGVPIVFVHEYASDLRAWESQVRHFARHYRCITFNARGYPPSDVPDTPNAYGQDAAVADIGAVLDHLGLDRAYLVGLSMGAGASLHYSLCQPHRVRGLVFASGGSGSDIATRAQFIADALKAADLLERDGMQPLVEGLSYGATRIQLLAKDPRGWQEFRDHVAEHSVAGSAHTMRNYQARRPSLRDFELQLKSLRVPTLILAGDEDEPVLEAALFLKRCIPASGLHVMAKTGHAVNLEEPHLFNSAVDAFFSAVERGRWGERDPRARPGRSALAFEAACPPTAA